MGNINFKLLKESLVSAKVPKPLSGTLSGHAAGEPFDKFVYAEIKKQFPKQTFRQYEYLNDLYLKNPQASSNTEKKKLFDSPTALFMLSRGEAATRKWNEENMFEEKQDDTADILISDGGSYELVDVKTRNVEKSAQAPNIISSYKLAWMCKYMIDNDEFDVLSLNYIEVDWVLKDKFLVCVDAFFGEMFKENPENLYINWAAAMQIQFHVSDMKQDFKGNVKEWCYSYLKMYVADVYRRTDYMIREYAKPFEPYLK